MTSSWQCLYHSGSHRGPWHVPSKCQCPYHGDCHEHMFIDGEIMFIQKSELWARVAMRMSPAMFFAWILCLILSQATMSSSSRVLTFVPMGQTATSAAQASLPTVQRERETKHTTSKSPHLHTIKGQYKHSAEDLYLSKASTLVSDSAKRADSGCLCCTLPQNHHHDLTSVFGAVVPSKLKAGAMLLSCNAYCV